MSTSENVTSYTFSAGPGGTTSSGTSYNANIAITVAAGSDFNDAAAWALHDALAAAFPAAWGIQSTDISLYKAQDNDTQYAPNYAAKTFS